MHLILLTSLNHCSQYIHITMWLYYAWKPTLYLIFNCCMGHLNGCQYTLAVRTAHQTKKHCSQCFFQMEHTNR